MKLSFENIFANSTLEVDASFLIEEVKSKKQAENSDSKRSNDEMEEEEGQVESEVEELKGEEAGEEKKDRGDLQQEEETNLQVVLNCVKDLVLLFQSTPLKVDKESARV
eukprot:CAMPEP_0202962560 /NCGR_PEP_ID=MMETSP1396-20130829/6664_1 /ASSEMBLY_ACC=CAM_ASM_000872 /TAXON_ID= /ORGANISM="Pseudokeronopsis sp., Strain Brazil" /LENGTH=108 /DNA_ID=CAMNT_0049683245 /DNA_START=802 /DNA_END=1128 /DNA_ORIENTATION=+